MNVNCIIYIQKHEKHRFWCSSTLNMQLWLNLRNQVPYQDFDDLEPNDCPPNPWYLSISSKFSILICWRVAHRATHSLYLISQRKNQKIKNLAQSAYKELLAWCFKKYRIEKDPIVAEKLNLNYASLVSVIIKRTNSISDTSGQSFGPKPSNFWYAAWFLRPRLCVPEGLLWHQQRCFRTFWACIIDLGLKVKRFTMYFLSFGAGCPPVFPTLPR